MTQVAIVGAGLIGRAWTIVFARAGFDVALWDPVGRRSMRRTTSSANACRNCTRPGCWPINPTAVHGPHPSGGDPGRRGARR